MMMMEMEINNNTTINNTTSNNPNPEATAFFPVTFFDGEKELDMGTIPITPSLTFKSFQSILSTKLQISPHQITIYFERFSDHYNNHHRRRHPVTSKFDFSSILPDSSSAFFWVVQKRSRRTRRRNNKPKRNLLSGNDLVLLRRRQGYDDNGGAEAEYFEYMNRLKMLQAVERERERYLMSMSLNSNVYDDLGFYYGGGNNGGFKGVNSNFSDDAASSSSSSAFCEICYNAAILRSYGGDDDDGDEGNTVPFHCCKNDVVTKVFRSPAGPIAPPSKKKNYFIG